MDKQSDEPGNSSGWRSLESVAGWDRFALYVKEDCSPPKYKVRWSEARKQRSEGLQARDLVSAREEALDVVAKVISPVEYIHDRKDPTFGEIWPSWEAYRAEATVIERQILLRSRWANYYRDRLGAHRCSAIETELKKLRDDLVKHGKPWKEGIKTSKGKLHPNTIDEIVNTARRAVNRAIKKKLVTDVSEIDVIKVPGYQIPKDRSPKGRYLEMFEIGRMIDAAGHNRDELLIECGCASRIGAITDLTIDQVFLRAGIFDLLPPGATQTAKGRPLAPISGPLWWVFWERIARNVADRHVLLYRSEGITKKTRSQTMRRIRVKAGLDDAHLVTWYSIRHTLGDFLFQRVSGLARSMLLGHAELFDESEKRKLLDPRSPTSAIYRREKLAPLYEIAEVLNREWWPEIQKHCKTDLRLGEADSQQIRLVYVSDLKQGGSGF